MDTWKGQVLTIEELVTAIRKKGFAIVCNPGQSVELKASYKAANLGQRLQAEFDSRQLEIHTWMTRPKKASDASEDWSEMCETCGSRVYRLVLVSGCSGDLGEGGWVRCPYRK